MFKQWIDTVHNQNVFPLRESNSIMSGNGKGFTLEDFSQARSHNEANEANEAVASPKISKKICLR